ERNFENQTTQHTDIVNRQILINFLAAHGVAIVNTASDEQISAALEKLGGRVTDAEATLVVRESELEMTRAELANEREVDREGLLDAALQDGRLTAARRPEWAARLTADFANASAELAQLAPTLKTLALTLNSGARKAEIASATERRDALGTLLKAEMARNG